jgi:hypothetical protein
MSTSWQFESAHLVHRWAVVGHSVEYNQQLCNEYPTMQSGHLPVTPDFASHSPFGKPCSWFLPHPSLLALEDLENGTA